MQPSSIPGTGQSRWRRREFTAKAKPLINVSSTAAAAAASVTAAFNREDLAGTRRHDEWFGWEACWRTLGTFIPGQSRIKYHVCLMQFSRSSVSVALLWQTS